MYPNEMILPTIADHSVNNFIRVEIINKHCNKRVRKIQIVFKIILSPDVVQSMLNLTQPNTVH